jgi:hypothetical protein
MYLSIQGRTSFASTSAVYLGFLSRLSYHQMPEHTPSPPRGTLPIPHPLGHFDNSDDEMEAMMAYPPGHLPFYFLG